METYIILFKDGSIMVWNRKPQKVLFENGSKLFKVPEETIISKITKWSARAYNWPEVFKPVEW